MGPTNTQKGSSPSTQKLETRKGAILQDLSHAQPGFEQFTSKNVPKIRLLRPEISSSIPSERYDLPL